MKQDVNAIADVALTIDGQEVKVPQGATVLEAALQAGIYIPTICYHPDLKPYGGCRLCIVQIQGMRGYPTACTTPANNGMVVTTSSPVLNDIRRTTMELILRSHPCECLTCNRRERCGPNDVCLRSVAVTDRCVTCPSNGTCELQKVADYLGMQEMTIPKEEKPRDIDRSNPFFDLDRNRCILCGRCTRTCQEITCVGAIDFAYRGYDMKVSTFEDKPLMESICRSCGECVVRCPVGALTFKDTTRPEYEVKTVCPYCGVGCSMYLGVKGDKVVSVRGDVEGAANHGRLCVKGRFGIAEFVNHEDRLKTPLIRKNGKLTQVTWDEALDFVAEKLASFNSDEVAVITSAKATNEDNYIIQKLARAVLGTNNVDHCARL